MEMEGSIQKNLASKVIIGIDFGTSGIAFAYGFQIKKYIKVIFPDKDKMQKFHQK